MKTVTTLYDKYLGNLSIHGWRDPQNPQLAQIFMEDKIYIPANEDDNHYCQVSQNFAIIRH